MSHSDQRGIVRGCCLGLLVLLIVIGGSVYLADRALAAPTLGARRLVRRMGPLRRRSRLRSAREMAAQLIQSPHGVVVLSEQDLTVLAVANNPHPNAFRDLQVRIRNGLVVVSAQVSAGPFTPTAVAHISLSLQPGPNGPVIAAQVPEVDIGMLGIPGFASPGLASQIDDGPVPRPCCLRSIRRLSVLRCRYRVRRRCAGRCGGRGARSRNRRPVASSCVTPRRFHPRNRGEHEGRVALDLRVIAQRRAIDAGSATSPKSPSDPACRQRGVRAIASHRAR